MNVKIVCFGDSLGVCGGEHGTYPELLQSEIMDCQVINCSVSGETLAGGRIRLQSDVLSINPDILVLELGANDFWLRNRSLNQIKDDYEYIVSSAKGNGIEVVIASCFGASLLRHGKDQINYDKVNLRLSEYAAGIAAIEAGLVVRYDCFYIPDIQIDIRPAGRSSFWLDDKHPSAAGNERVAARIKYQVLKAVEKIGKPVSVGRGHADRCFC